MLVTVVMSMLVVRLLISRLGTDDFGLLMVLAASAALLGMAVDALTVSAGRTLAVEFAGGDRNRVSELFNTLMGLFAIAGCLAMFVGVSAVPFLVKLLKVPSHRVPAAELSLILLVIGVALLMFTAPYRCVIEARQEIPLNTVAEVLAACARFAAVLVLPWLPGDDIVVFAGLSSLLPVLIQVVLAAVVTYRFPECRLNPSIFRRGFVNETVSFAGWASVWYLVWRLRVQASQILLNLFFGVTVNAGYAVAEQLGAYHQSLGFAVHRAAQSAMNALAARDAQTQIRVLATVYSKYRGFISALVVIPLLIETPVLLALWLEEVPAYAVMFTRLTLVALAGEGLTAGHHVALYASGQIRGYTLMLAALDIAYLCVTVALFWLFEAPPWYLPMNLVVLALVTNIIRCAAAGPRIGVSTLDWLAVAIRPLVLAVAPAGAVCFIVHSVLQPGVTTAVISIVAFYLAVTPSIWWLGLTSWERAHFHRIAAGAMAAGKRFARVG